MALERIPPLLRLPSTRSPVDAGRAAARAAGEQARLRLPESPPGELPDFDADGTSFRLGSTVAANMLLLPGQILRVRILRTTPTLEFVVLGGAEDIAEEAGGGMPRSSRPPFFTDADPAALQTDQAAMQRLTRATIEPAALASAWHALVLSQLYRASIAPRAQPADMPANTAANTAAQPFADEAAALPLRIAGSTGSADPPTRPGETVLVLSLQAWAGWPVTLWLVQRGGPYAGTNRRAAQRNSVRLRLALDLPAWGPIGIEIDVLDNAVALTLSTPRPEVLPLLRDGVTRIVQRLVASGLRLVRCRVQQGEPCDVEPMSSARDLGALAAVQPPLALFRAATELLAALSPPSR